MIARIIWHKTWSLAFSKDIKNKKKMPDAYNYLREQRVPVTQWTNDLFFIIWCRIFCGQHFFRLLFPFHNQNYFYFCKFLIQICWLISVTAHGVWWENEFRVTILESKLTNSHLQNSFVFKNIQYYFFL